MQGSARSALTKACVPSESLPHALAFNTLTSYVGEFSAPGLFYLTVTLGGKAVTLTLNLTLILTLILILILTLSLTLTLGVQGVWCSLYFTH